MFETEISKAAEKLVGALKKAGKTISTAESCTGGMISEAITSVSGASEVFSLGLCVYSEEKKTKILGVPAEVIKKYGVVSSQTVLSMAENAKRLAFSDYSLSVSGVAGPSGGTAENPVGTVWIGWEYPGGSGSEVGLFPGGRDDVRKGATLRALGIMIKIINGDKV